MGKIWCFRLFQNTFSRASFQMKTSSISSVAYATNQTFLCQLNYVDVPFCSQWSNVIMIQISALFCSPPPPAKFSKITFLKNFRLLKVKPSFSNRKLTSIRVVFRLNKTLFTHFDYNYVRIKCLLMTQNRKLLISLSKMRNYIGKKCEQSLYLNPKLSPWE